MSNFVYDNEALVAGKENLSLRPTVPAHKKIVASEWNTLAAALTDLSNATKAGVFHGLVGGQSPDVAPTGGTRLKGGAAGLEVSFSGGAYAPVGGTVADASGSVAGKVNLVDQTLGAGRKTLPGAVLFLSDPTAPVSAAGGTTIRNNAGAFEVSQNGGAYATITALTSGTPATLTSSGGNVAVNLAASLNFVHTTTQTTIIDAPTGAAAGQAGVIEFLCGNSTYTVGFNAFWRFSGGFIPTVTPVVGARDLLVYYVNAAGTSATCSMESNC